MGVISLVFKDNVVLFLRFPRGSGSHQEAHIIYTFARTNGKTC